MDRKILIMGILSITFIQSLLFENDRIFGESQYYGVGASRD